MDSVVLFEQLLVLCAMIATGFIAFKAKVVDKRGFENITSLVVWVLNPFLAISGVVGKECRYPLKDVLENLMMVGILYIAFFVIGYIYVKIFRYKNGKDYLYRLCIFLPNVGFMGIPLVKAMFGEEYIIFVVFYSLVYNLLAYTVGVIMAGRIGGREVKLSAKNLMTPGVFFSVIAILIFALRIKVPGPVLTYIDYVGNASIPLSMVIIGCSLAQMDLKSAFLKGEYYIFLLLKMILIPFVIIVASKHLLLDVVKVNETLFGIFIIMLCMPVGSMTTMIAQEYGGDGSECTKLIAITTIGTVVTAPLVAFLAGLI